MPPGNHSVQGSQASAYKPPTFTHKSLLIGREVSPSEPFRVKFPALNVHFMDISGRVNTMTTVIHQYLRDKECLTMQRKSEEQVSVFKHMPKGLIPAADGLEHRSTDERDRRDDNSQPEYRLERRSGLPARQTADTKATRYKTCIRTMPLNHGERGAGTVDQSKVAKRHRSIGMILKYAEKCL